MTTCPNCGGPKANRYALQCRTCRIADRQAAARPAPTCVDCGAILHRKGGKIPIRCGPCYHKGPTHVVPTRSGKFGRYRKDPTRVPTFTDAEAAWLGAIFTGEGSLSMRPRKAGYMRDPHLSVGNTDMLLLERLKSITGAGGIYYDSSHQKFGYKPFWRWIVGSIPDVIAIVEQVYPYLVGKEADWRAKIEETKSDIRP